MKIQKAMREGFKARILELTRLLKESQEHTSYEMHPREEINKASRNPHAIRKKALEELTNVKAYNQCLKKVGETLKKEWGVRVQHLESLVQ